MKGFISINRESLETLMYDKNLLQLYIYCCQEARYADTLITYNGEIIHINRGSFVTGRLKLANILNQKEGTVRDRLKRLENLHLITIKTTSSYSVITIVNYGLEQYQNLKSANKPTTNYQQTDTNINKEEKKKRKTYDGAPQ